MLEHISMLEKIQENLIETIKRCGNGDALIEYQILEQQVIERLSKLIRLAEEGERLAFEHILEVQ